MSQTTTDQTDRNSRRREQTRAKLIEAAKVLFARQGAERTRINEITEQADVGFGSFYNHFESKEEIVSEVLRESAADHAQALVAATSGISDPAEVISIAHRHFVRVALADPEWAGLAVRLEDSSQAILDSLRPFAREDLERAISAGRVDVPDVEVALYAAGGALQGVIRAVLDGRVGAEAEVVHAAMVLRMFGLPATEADEIAGRPFPGDVLS